MKNSKPGAHLYIIGRKSEHFKSDELGVVGMISVVCSKNVNEVNQKKAEP